VLGYVNGNRHVFILAFLLKTSEITSELQNITKGIANYLDAVDWEILYNILFVF